MTEKKIIRTREDANEFLFKEPYLAFLDILGFSALVANNPHERLEDLYDNIFTETVQRVDGMMKDLKEKYGDKRPEGATDTGLKIINISDSIIMWTAHGQPEALFEIVFAASALMGISMVRGLPLRGCITRQRFSVRENDKVTSVFGRGLVHAYNTEKSQAWSGCMIDSEIISYFRGIEEKFKNKPASSPIDRLIHEYNIPLYLEKEKRHTTTKGFAIEWTEQGMTDQLIKEAFDAHNKKDDRPGSETPNKIDNTIAFHQFCQQKKQEQQEKLRRLEEALNKAEKKEDNK